jgi:putative flippase GtrA
MKRVINFSKTVFSKKRSNNFLVQFSRYIFVGSVATVVDIGMLFLLTSVIGVHYLLSAALAFVMGIIVNYKLSTLWIFEKTNKRKTEITIFTLIGIVGLGLNELILWIAVEEFAIYYVLAKIISTAIILIWNFTARRFLFAKLKN